MKTTIDIDQNLLRQAQKALGTDTIKGTVERSLRRVIQHSQLREFADALGTIPPRFDHRSVTTATAQTYPPHVSTDIQSSLKWILLELMTGLPKNQDPAALLHWFASVTRMPFDPR